MSIEKPALRPVRRARLRLETIAAKFRDAFGVAHAAPVDTQLKSLTVLLEDLESVERSPAPAAAAKIDLAKPF